MNNSVLLYNFYGPESDIEWIEYEEIAQFCQERCQDCGDFTDVFD